MNILGIGVDIVENSRISQSLEKKFLLIVYFQIWKFFLQRILKIKKDTTLKDLQLRSLC